MITPFIDGYRPMVFLSLARRACVPVAMPWVAHASRPFVPPVDLAFTACDPVRTLGPMALRRIDGRPAFLKRPRNRVLLLTVWATWCPVCRTALPLLAEARLALSALGIDVVAVSTDAGPVEDVNAFLHERGVTDLPVYVDPHGETMRADRSDGARSPFAAVGIPTSFIIDAEGRVRGSLGGGIDWRDRNAQALLRRYLSS